MPKRLAITIAGAVSLGSYEAGVLYEVLEAIDFNNRNLKSNDSGRIVIDVLTGASAGGMTAIILAQKLLYSADEFSGPYDNPLYNTWVKRISLAGLQTTGNDEAALYSIFSSNLIESISRETLLQRYSAEVPAAVAHSSVSGELRVGVALTNLNGIAYGYPVIPGGKFVYIDYGDQLTRHVVGSACDNAGFWEPLRQAAVASGAFPFAFRTRDLARSAKNEPDDYAKENLEPWQHDPKSYTYSDGGILQNQPLGMAKNLVDLIDNHRDQENRFYLFVSPHEKDPDTNNNFRSSNADYFHLLQRLVDAVVGQAGFEDWITAKAMNARLALLDKRAKGLMEAIVAKEIDVPCLATTAISLLDLFFSKGEYTAPGATAPETLEQAQGRIARQFEEWMSDAERNIPGSGNAFRDAVLAFETAAELGARDHMTIYGITAKETELASAGLEAFLGFFNQELRDHDYDVGRSHARAILRDSALALPGALGPFEYPGTSIRSIDSSLDGLRMSHLASSDLRLFKTGMRKRLNEMLKELWGPLCSLPAIPGSDLILESVLDRLIQKE